MTKVRDVNEIINFFSSVLEHRVGEAPVVAGAPNLKRFLAEDTRWPIKGFDEPQTLILSLKHSAAGGG
jgi:hypothetical protein